MKTQTESKHTPTPWHITNKGYNHYIQKNYDGTNEFTVSICSGNQGMAKANAAFIISAVNSHEALLEAAKCLVHDIEISGGKVSKFVKEAIQQAEGK